MDKLLAKESEINRATALFTLLEQANPKAYDLSPVGMARTGVDILRCLAAITLRTMKVTTEPLALVRRPQSGPFTASGRIGTPAVDPVSRPCLRARHRGGSHSGEHGRDTLAILDQWIFCDTGPARTDGSFEAMHRFVVEIVACSDPYAMVVGRIRDGEALPGFDSDTPSATVHPAGDPRARAMFEICDAVLAKDPAFVRLKAVARQSSRRSGTWNPSFALMCVFVGWKIGLNPQDSLFHLGARPAGLRTRSSNIKPERPIASPRPTKGRFRFDHNGDSQLTPPRRIQRQRIDDLDQS